jgi:hypothetical protein
MVNKNKSKPSRQVVVVDFSEQVVCKEEFRPDVECSLCHARGSFTIVWPENQARTFGSRHGLCEQCLHLCFDVVKAI